VSIIALAASYNDLASASAYALAASLASHARTEVAREVFAAAIASANATLAAAQDADADAWGAAQDAALAAEQAQIAIVAALMAERHLDRAAARGNHAHPSDADGVPSSMLSRALAAAGVEAPECVDQIDALRTMLRAAIAELMASDATERAAYDSEFSAAGEVSL